jgi:hypothetical protein
VHLSRLFTFFYTHRHRHRRAQGPPRGIAAFLPILIPVAQLGEGRVTDTCGRDPRHWPLAEKVQSSLLGISAWPVCSLTASRELKLFVLPALHRLWYVCVSSPRLPRCDQPHAAARPICTMESRRRHHPFKKLIRRIVNLIDDRPADTSEPKHSQTSSAFRYLSRPSLAAMADQEEDFSSLPLPDRFSHKVRITCLRSITAAPMWSTRHGFSPFG